MDKYIGSDVDDKRIIARVVQSDHPDRYATFPTEVGS